MASLTQHMKLTGTQASNAHPNMANMSEIIRSVRADITRLKSQLESLPPMPEGRRPPSPLARFQNNVERLDKDLKFKSNRHALSQQGRRPQTTLEPLPEAYEEPVELPPHFSLVNRPLKKVMEEQKYSFLTSDPENTMGHDLIRGKFGISKPN